jgi:hypothetical protein
VLVTGIQPRRVCAVKRLFAPKDLGLRDSCDEHRNEGRGRELMVVRTGVGITELEASPSIKKATSRPPPFFSANAGIKPYACVPPTVT